MMRWPNSERRGTHLGPRPQSVVLCVEEHDIGTNHDNRGARGVRCPVFMETREVGSSAREREGITGSKGRCPLQTPPCRRPDVCVSLRVSQVKATKIAMETTVFNNNNNN